MNPKNPKKRLQIKTRDAFGRLCETLAADEVPFSLGPSLTIVVQESVLERLPQASRLLLKELEDRKLLDRSQDRDSGKRKIPTAKEAEEACWRAVKAL